MNARDGSASARSTHAEPDASFLPPCSCSRTTLLAAPLVLSPLDLRRIADDGLAASLSLANMRFAARRHRLLRARRCLADAPLLVAGRRGAVLPPVADPAVDRRAHRASATRDGRPRDRGPRRLVRPVHRADGHVERLGVLLAADPRLAARRQVDCSRSAHRCSVACHTRSRPRSAGSVQRCWGRVSWRSGRRRPIRAWPRCCRRIGAVALIASGGVVGSPGWIALARAPLRWLGRISYSLYLWHWPILVLGPVALGLGVAAEEEPATTSPSGSGSRSSPSPSPRPPGASSRSRSVAVAWSSRVVDAASRWRAPRP